ncbi:hypothetical protein BT96DRAFT_399329 [Gymnopus androsaceus JB14]|uniref:Uncharacterized protein n=1 Tax=Gymnopus androsaceus JB14 TaxID=1447944 RepID=A0A6A4GUT3_9AGAR|nr:hypothetical protein BT96DRAFT_399329 [Gymnopus androsaceus JB14]
MNSPGGFSPPAKFSLQPRSMSDECSLTRVGITNGSNGLRWLTHFIGLLLEFPSIGFLRIASVSNRYCILFPQNLYYYLLAPPASSATSPFLVNECGVRGKGMVDYFSPLLRLSISQRITVQCSFPGRYLLANFLLSGDNQLDEYAHVWWWLPHWTTSILSCI